MINYLIYEEKTKEIHGKLSKVVKSSDIINQDTDAMVLLTLKKDVSGDVEIRAPVSDEVGQEIKSSLRSENIGKDIFLVMCKGSFSFQDRTVSLYCGIKNEDGMPVTLLKDFNAGIKEKINSFAENLLDVFYKT